MKGRMMNLAKKEYNMGAKRKSPEIQGFVLSYLDSNQDKLIQSQMCYRYTIGQGLSFARKRVQNYNIFFTWQIFLLLFLFVFRLLIVFLYFTIVNFFDEVVYERRLFCCMEGEEIYFFRIFVADKK